MGRHACSCSQGHTCEISLGACEIRLTKFVRAACLLLLQQQPCSLGRSHRHVLGCSSKHIALTNFRANQKESVSESSLHLSAHTMAACTSDFPHLTLKHVFLHRCSSGRTLGRWTQLVDTSSMAQHVLHVCVHCASMGFTDQVPVSVAVKISLLKRGFVKVCDADLFLADGTPGSSESLGIDRATERSI